MKTKTILFALTLGGHLASAGQPTLELLALKVETLERQVSELKMALDTTNDKKRAEELLRNAKRPEIIIDILKNGRIRVEGTELGDEEVTVRLKPILNEFPNQPIRIKGDREVKYQDIVRVTDLLQRSGGWNLTFGPKKP